MVWNRQSLGLRRREGAALSAGQRLKSFVHGSQPSGIRDRREHPAPRLWTGTPRAGHLWTTTNTPAYRAVTPPAAGASSR
jgi:hypothetical protein